MNLTRLKTAASCSWRWAKPFLVALIVMGAVRSAVADWNDVPSGSMKPSILEGDRIFVNKVAYDLKVPFTSWRLARWAEPMPGDIVVFYEPLHDQRYVKRVVGLPGDVIELRDNRLTVNGRAVSYAVPDQARAASDPLLASEDLSGRTHPILLTPGVASRCTFGPMKVPEGCYFLMGDNRDVSFDSRYFGVVERDRIQGRATSVLLSLDPEHGYAPRWDRFFQGLP